MFITKFLVCKTNGGCINDNRNKPEAVMITDGNKCFHAIHAGHVDVQNDELGQAASECEIVQELQNFLSILQLHYTYFTVVLLKQSRHKFQVFHIIISKNDVAVI